MGTPEGHNALAEEIFADALDQRMEGRAAYVRARCEGNAALAEEVEEVEQLLVQFDSLGSFLDLTTTPVRRPEQETLDEGTLLADRFVIQEQLGQGGMGVVYRAEDLELGETVALKMVRDVWLDDPVVLTRFRDEIRLARKITHPNICRIHDLFNARINNRNRVFFSMEYLAGESLSGLLQTDWRPDEEEILRIARSIAAGLDAAHGAGIIHRDLKPSNIVLKTAPDGTRRAVIMDFGLARTLDQNDAQSTRTAQIVGSPEYMAPEQFLGNPATPATDVFSFATIIYEIINQTAAVARGKSVPGRPAAGQQ